MGNILAALVGIGVLAISGSIFHGLFAWGLAWLAFAWQSGGKSNDKTELEAIRQTYKRLESSGASLESLKKADLFSNGLATEVITEKALSAADDGDMRLQVLVGSAYLSGSNGLPQDVYKGSRYLLAAARQGDGYAAYVMSGLYAKGIGVDADFDEARRWALRAKQLGELEADEMLQAIDNNRLSN